MRPGIDSATQTLYESGTFGLHHRFKVANDDGTYIDLEGRYTGGSLSLPNADVPIGSLTIDLLREVSSDGTDSLSPLVGVSELNRLDDGTTFAALLQVGHAVTLEMALTAVGGARPASDSALWYEVFRGNISGLGFGKRDGRIISLRCNDQSGFLQVAKSTTEYTYAAGISYETAIQQVLDNNGFSGITLNTPVATGKVLGDKYTPGVQKSPWSQIWGLAQSFGWLIWWRYQDDGTAALTLFEPERDKTTADMTVAQVYDYPAMDIDERDIKNEGRCEYSDSNKARQTVGPVQDTDSIAKYGGPDGIARPFWISFLPDSPVRTSTAATNVLTAAVSDISEPDVIATAFVPPMIFAECSVDLYTFPADGRFFDSDQKLAPFTVTVDFRANQDPTSSVGVRGKPSAGKRTWDGVITPPPAVSEPISVYSLTNFREVEASAAGKRKWAWTARGAKVDSVWAASKAFTVPFDEADAWATVAAAVTPIPSDQDYVEIDVPAGDENVLLQVEPRLADLTVYDAADVVERVQLYPVPTFLDVVLSATIVSNLVDLSLKLTAGAGSMPYPATALVYEGDATGTLLASFTFSADGTKTKADDSDLGGRSLPAEGKKVWTVVVTDRTGTVYAEEVPVNAPRLPYFDGVRSVLSADLLSVDIYGTVTDPAGLGGTLEYWLPADEETATDPSGSATGSVVITAANMPYAMGPVAITDFNDVTTVGNAFSLVLKFTASDGRTTGKQTFPLAGSMQFLVDTLGKLRAESVHNGLVLLAGLRPYYLGSGAPTLDVDDYETDRYFDTTALQAYAWDGDSWEEDDSTPTYSYAPILRAGIVTSTILAADAAILTLVGANRVVAENVNIGSLELISDDAGAIVNGSFINAAGTAGLDLDATGTDRVFWAGGTAGSEKIKVTAAGVLTISGYAETTDLDGLSASIRAASAPTTRSDGSALVDGDGWLDSDNGNKPYTWNGTSWVAAYTEIDGGAITTGSIVSGNYSAGSAGWSIDTDGSAEFNDVTVRGELDGATGTFSGTLTAEDVRLSAGGNLVLEPSTGFTEGNIEFWDDTNAVFSSVEADYTGLGQGLKLLTVGSGRDIYMYPAGNLRMQVKAATLSTDETALFLHVAGAGTYAGLKQVKVNASGLLSVA